MTATSVECGDFLEFQDTLKKMRLLDDKIIYTLNTAIPTESFKGQVDSIEQCKDLFQQIKSIHLQREQAITKCLNVTKGRVMQLKNLRDNGDERPTLIKNLRNEQTTLRLLQAELNIEEVLKRRTVQVYYERCRGFYKPSHVNTEVINK
ncbi:Coiled-coil domain-containing protein 58 [Camponotus floridanus]|uniref:Protein MIX23 n=1 Tax=Camponotus floridanus TaxID=104421 RepID=E2AKH3_CAMFO|nr:coiled-coil domain-containing protein 58 isoform X1 [Camponotus floridanus]XP_019883736.1 coiled-coil domain-containing protein 58 isoform X2 [Camponotus floridanus]EFN66065.1 Coiled-coil domain-containing protein 58 [Camponotus floridanus]